MQAFNRGKLDFIATLNAYRQAKINGQWQLANRIRFATCDFEQTENLQNLANEFDFIDKQLALLPVHVSED
jgi:hypothetical protein